MSRRRRRAPHVNHERWLVSYADFITLLFAFFVVLYASSQVDKRKVGRLAMAIQVAFEQMGVFQTPASQLTLDVPQPIALRSTQAFEAGDRAAIVRIASPPESAADRVTENGDLVQLQSDLETALASEIRRKEIAMRREADGLSDQPAGSRIF